MAESCAVRVLLLAEESVWAGERVGRGDKDAHEKCFRVVFAPFLQIPNDGKTRKTGTVF